MTIEPKELLLRMKECEYLFDSKLGQTINKNYEEDKKHVLKILDLLYQNYERVRYVDDLSDSKIGKKKWGLLISEKFAMMDKRVPIPQVPFHLVAEGKNKVLIKPKHAYLMLQGFFHELEDEICVVLNFKDKECRKVFRENVSYENLAK
ncbi:hypothetical protein [Bacillus sp. Marseille-Q3570]|uniref:hypothetical protein n=1 Tax=Bacillus sp. Marseille-Q3570 TaxID=2963522 RepID=UPI0021B8429A|nr:hypothetical protein [Bacillus sp. Marseille-Q3570]